MNAFVLSVSEYNDYVNKSMSADSFLSEIWVQGEVKETALKNDILYFVIADNTASVECMLFDFSEFEGAEQIQPGETFQFQGDASLYWRNGSFKIIIRQFDWISKGALAADFEKIKNELEKLGVFDLSRKRALPKFPRKIGIVTSASGAVIQDIKNVVGRRDPSVKLTLYPVKVQGENAPEEITAGISYFNNNTDVDLLIVGRGGGSAEDLSAFNDKGVVLSIFNSGIPVISAVGHETDVSLADFAADLRAPTPSAAAELAVPQSSMVYQRLNDLTANMRTHMNTLLNEKEDRLNLRIASLQKDQMLLRIRFAQNKIEGYRDRFTGGITNIYQTLKMRYNTCRSVISDLNPESIFKRGYSVALLLDRAIRRAEEVEVGNIIRILLDKGSLTAKVIDVNEE